MNSYLKNNVVSISLATSLSKLAGFIRQIFIAAAFGIGITYDAFNYAYIIPGFLLIIIGGINGPLHNAVVAVITPLDTREGGIVLTKASIKLTLLFKYRIQIYSNIPIKNLNSLHPLISLYRIKFWSS